MQRDQGMDVDASCYENAGGGLLGAELPPEPSEWLLSVAVVSNICFAVSRVICLYLSYVPTPFIFANCILSLILSADYL